MQTGSAFILIASFFGAVPSSETVPLTLPAFAVSTFCPDGAPAGDEGVAELLDVSWPPPHAVIDAATAQPRTTTQAFRRRIDLSCIKKDAKPKSNPIFYLASSIWLRGASARHGPRSSADPTTRPDSPSGRRPAA